MTGAWVSSPMKKIVHLTTVHHVLDNRIFFKQCVGLAKSGYSVVLIAPHNKAERIDGVQIEPLSISSSRVSRVLVGSWAALRSALTHRADVYQFHDPELIPVGLILKVLGRRVVYDIHEDYITSIAQKTYIPRLIRGVLSRLVGRSEQIASCAFELVIAEKYYRRRFPRAVEVLNYPADSPKVSRSASQVGRCSVGTQGSTPIRVLYTGGITIDRGALIHADIVNYLAEAEVHFIGRCSKSVAERIWSVAGPHRGRIRITGVDEHVPFQDIVAEYQSGHWVCGLALFPDTPHYREKELTKFFEYMAYGIPIVCSNFPTWSALMRSSKSGIAVDPSNRQEIASAVMRLANDDELWCRAASAGRAAVAERYTWGSQLDNLIALYEAR